MPFVRHIRREADVVQTVETALQCGVTCFRFREKGKEPLYGDKKEAVVRA